MAAATRSRERVAPLPIGAWLSVWLRSLLLVTSVSAPAFFLRTSQTARADRLVQSVRQHVQFRRHFRHAPSRIEQVLRLLQHLGFQHRRRTMPRLRLVEPLGAVVPVQLHIPLHRDHRHAKRLDDLFGFHRPACNHLAGEHAETPHVLLLVLEYRQVAVEIKHPARLFLYCDLAVDLRHPGRKHRQLKLRHSSLLPQLPPAPQVQIGIIPFSLPGKNHGARSGDLKFPGDDWRREEFTTHSVTLAGGETVTMQLAERGSQLSNKLWLREIRKLTESGHQTSILTTNFQAPMTTLAVSLFARWSQENFFRYMREHFSLDRLIEYGTELIPDAISVVNPAWRTFDSQIRSKTGQRYRRAAQFGTLALSEDPSDSQVQGFQQRKGQLREEIQALDLEIDNLKQQRKKTEHHIPVKSLPEEDRFTRLRTERKHFIDTLKMIAYRAETSMASLLREHMARGGDDARALLRQIFQSEADLTPDLAANTLTVRLHHLTQAAHDQAIEQMLADLNATQTVFPGTTLTLVFKLGSA